jgi:cysteine synthase A
MPDTVASTERIKLMEAYGAEIHFVDVQDEGRSLDAGVHGALSEIVPRMKCRDVEASRPDVWWARQFSNLNNVAAHRETTGREILRQTEGKVDAAVASIGTGGTLMGVAQALEEELPDCELIAVEPAEDPVLGRGKDGMPIIEGITDGIALEMLDTDLVDDVVLVSDGDAIATAHLLAEKEGLFCGISSGANVFAAMKVAERLGESKTIVAILPDSKDRYLSIERYIT